MDYTRLGSSGLKVSRIALGCMSFGDTSRGFNEWALDDQAAEPIFRQAVDGGVTLWDTANAYGYGTSEEIVGRALKKYTRRDDIVLATMEALHDVVKAGKARYLGASSTWAWQFAKMQHVAATNGWTRFISMQNQYSLMQREEEREMFGLLADQGVGSIPWSPLAKGRLARPWGEATRRSDTRPDRSAVLQ